MKKYQVKITGKALADMEEIYNSIESLDNFPEWCTLFDSEPEGSYGMRSEMQLLAA
jgi:hypothetical protein